MAMAKELKPYKIIENLFEQRRSCSDEEILSELAALPVLPDEDDLMNQKDWDNNDWDNVFLFLALADQAAVRRLRPALALLLERASYGDPGETMRGLRHSLEAIVDPEWDVLTDVCMAVAIYPQRGARLWAIDELGRLRDERARPVLMNALNDPEEEIRKTAQRSIEMLDAAQS